MAEQHRKSLAVLLLGFILGFTLSSPSQSKYTDDTAKQIAVNTIKLAELEHDVRELEAWREQHTRDHATSNGELAGELRELKVISEHHEKLLWFFAFSIIGLAMKVVYDHFKTRAPKRYRVKNGYLITEELEERIDEDGNG